jgi:hypothetical protein
MWVHFVGSTPDDSGMGAGSDRGDHYLEKGIKRAGAINRLLVSEFDKEKIILSPVTFSQAQDTRR